MKYNQYRFKFYINASHSIYLNGKLGEEHPHTWEIIINTIKLKDNFIIFNDIEKDIEKYLSKFQDVYINDVEPFTTLNPTLENICNYFKESFQNLLLEKGWLLLSIEISETPARSYIIDVSDEADSTTLNSDGCKHLSDVILNAACDKIDNLKNNIERKHMDK